MNLKQTLISLQINPHVGLPKELIEKQKQDMQLQDIAFLDALTASLNPSLKTSKRIKVFEHIKLNSFFPIIISIIVSFVGWCFESMNGVNSINFSNLISLSLFLPIFIWNDKFSSPENKKNIHSKDMLILTRHQNSGANDMIGQVSNVGSQLMNEFQGKDLFKDNFILRRIKEFVQVRFTQIIDQFKNKNKFIVLRNQQWITVNSSELYVGDVIFLKQGQLSPVDCQILPSYSSQAVKSFNNNSVFMHNSGYGQVRQPIIISQFSDNFFQSLCHNIGSQDDNAVNRQILETGLNLNKKENKSFINDEFPVIRQVQLCEDKIVSKTQKVSCFFELQSIDKDLFNDYLFAGYFIDSILNPAQFYFTQINTQNIIQDFLAANPLKNETQEQIDFIDTIYKQLQQGFNMKQVSSGDAVIVQLYVDSGVYAVVTNTRSDTQIFKYSNKLAMVSSLMNKSPITMSNGYMQFQKKATIPSTFFTHLDTLDKFMKKLPISLLTSILLIFVPLIFRSMIIPSYSSMVSTDMKGWGDEIMYGLIPSLCSTTVFTLSALIFAYQSFSFLRPILKSASKYVSVLNERQMTIPTLGSLESLGFTNTIVFNIDSIFAAKKEVFVINIGNQLRHQGQRMFSQQDIKKYGLVFNNKVLRPFEQIFNQSGQSQLLNLTRFVASLSLKNEEIWQLLKQSPNIRNIYSMDYQQRQSKPQKIRNEEIVSFANQQSSSSRQIITSKQKYKSILNTQVQMPFFSSNYLHEFQQDYLLDFSYLIQPQCLTEASIAVHTYHPLATYPISVHKCLLKPEGNEGFLIIRSARLSEIIQFCNKIISHTDQEQQQVQKSSNSFEDNEEVQYYPLFGQQASNFYCRDLTQMDQEYLNGLEKQTRKKVTDIVHYAILPTLKYPKDEEEIFQFLQENKMIYYCSIGFKNEPKTGFQEFVKRFEKQELGMNLVLSTKKSKQDIQPYLDALDLQEYVPDLNKEATGFKYQSTYSQTKLAMMHQTNSVEEDFEFSKLQQMHSDLYKSINNTKQLIGMDNFNIKQKHVSKVQTFIVPNAEQPLRGVASYILSKSLVCKKNIIKDKHRDKKLKNKSKIFFKKIKNPKEKEQTALIDDIPNLDYQEFDSDQQLQEFAEFEESNNEYYREIKEETTFQTVKTAKQHRIRRIKKAASGALITSQKGCAKRQEKPEPSVFILTDQDNGLHTAAQLSQQGLFVSYVNMAQGPTVELSEVIEKNQKQTNQQNPDFLLINYQQQMNDKALQSQVDYLQQSINSRISLCSVEGKHGMNRILDACQEIPFYFMTLSPVFLGVIRSRLMIGLLPFYTLFIVTLLELINCLQIRKDGNYIQQMQTQMFYSPPISVGVILIFSLIYIEILLPYIIWTPPKSLGKSTKPPQFVGNRAAMLWDFNKLLPRKTSHRALIWMSLIFLVSIILVTLPASNYYFGLQNNALDDFIQNQQLRLSPYISLYICLFFTGYATGALLLTNKLPLGKIWGHKMPLKFTIQKIGIFILLQMVALIFVFVMPFVDDRLSWILLGFNQLWVDDRFVTSIIISFGSACLISIFVILEQSLFVRDN